MLIVPVPQGSTAQAPPAPPVPPLPSSPGEATGAAQGTPAPAAPGSAENQVIEDIRRGIQDGIQDGMRTEQVISVPPPYRENDDIPKEVIPIIGIVFGSIVAIVLGYPIVRLITRLIDKATDRSMLRASDVSQQLKTLQDSVDTMAIEIERISESQRFQDRLLSERAPAQLPESRG